MIFLQMCEQDDWPSLHRFTSKIENIKQPMILLQMWEQDDWLTTLIHTWNEKYEKDQMYEQDDWPTLHL
jgi:hypothetical protein